MKEIEVKAKINDIVTLKKRLEDIGCIFSEALNQEDRIYFPKGKTIGNFKLGTACMRIRDSNGVCTWNMKKALTGELDNIEHETIIDNPEEAHNIIINLGYEEAVRVSKKRLKCRYAELEICLDDVKGLGSFIEVEKLADEDSDSEAIQEQLFAFVMSIGVKREDQVLKGYDTMTAELNDK